MAIELNDDLWARILYTTTRDNLTLLASLQTVNRYWRDLIISDCLLWTKIDIKHQAHLTKLAFLDVFLKRSGEAPLDISIELPDYTSLTQPYIFLCRLQQVATRIKSLRLSLYNYQLIESFILGIGQGQPAPYLEKLSITTKSPDSIFFMSDTTFPSLESAFTPSLRLRHLTIPSWPLPKSIQAIPQLSTITTFLIDVSSQPMDMDCALELLKAAHVLEHLSFNGYNLVSWGSVGSATDTARIIEMPHLRSVNLSAPGYGIELLRNISAPLLEKITLYDWPSKDGYETMVLIGTIPSAR
ncbi:hypothetical protein CPB83DRAFT_843314 [Crepidotus variabilis]|uniref:F-box domain-containing protein n=1 Tax=Crepidotus variabilis TaxID=179855 RepID=A0A9P6EU69_9AGAR|nr:hypothetical protein CPB83DRAFT_843314 [Crepidotus variabilis]